jgi:hypothetical protein
MFELILKALKTKFPGVDAKILERIAKKKAETTTKEEEVKTVVDGVTFQSILESEGDRRADEAQKTAVTNYEKKYKLKDGKPTDEPAPKTTPSSTNQPTGGEDSEVMKMLKEIKADNEQLRNELNGFKSEKLGNQRKQQFEALFEGASDKLKERYMRNYDRLSFKDDEDFNGWLDSQKPFIEDDIKTEKAAGATNTPPLGGTRRKPGEQADPAVTAYLNAEAVREQQAASPVIIGLTQGAPATPAPPAQ